MSFAVSRPARNASHGSKPRAAPGAGADTQFARWEYYAGGVIGLLLGFVLRLQGLNDADAILVEGIASAARSLVWFLAFALFERILWTDRQRVVALAAGIAALLLNLCVSGGIGQPSVAGPLWLCAALALASLQLRPRVFSSTPLPSLGLPVGVLGATAMIYVVYCFYPVSSSLSVLRKTGRIASFIQYDRILLPSFCASTVSLYAANNEGMTMVVAAMLRLQTPVLLQWANRAPLSIERDILKSLEEAKDDDRDNARLWIQLGTWYGQDWEFRHEKTKDRAQQLALAQHARAALSIAQQLDPNSLEPLQAQVQLFLTFARYHKLEAQAARRAMDVVKANPKLKSDDRENQLKIIEDKEKGSLANEKEYLDNAVATLRKAVNLDPTDAPLHCQLAELLDRDGDPVACHKEASTAMRLHNLSTLPRAVYPTRNSSG